MMANNYRGADTAGAESGFVGIDEDGLGDGAGKSRPMSTGLQNRMQGNTMYLAEGAACSSFAPIIDQTTLSGAGAAQGDRPWTSVRWSSIGVWQIPVSPGFRGIRFNGVYNVQEAASTATNDVEMLVRLGPVTNTSADVAAYTLACTQSAGNPNYSVMFTTPSDGEITLPKAVTKSGVMRFEIWVRGDAGGDTGIAPTITYGGFFAQAGNATDFDQENSGPFESGAGTPLEVCQLVDTDGLHENEGVERDMLGPLKIGDGTLDAMAVHPPPAGYTAKTVATKISYLMFVQLRGLWIRPLFDITSATPAIAANPVASMLPNIASSAKPLLRQVAAMREIQRRPRILAIGPEGILDSTAGREDYQGRGYPMRWPFSDGDETQGEVDATIDPPLIEDSIFVDAENPYIVVRCGFIPVHMRQEGGPSVFRRLDRLEDVERDMGLASWDFELKIHQLKDAQTSARWHTATFKNNLVPGKSNNDGETFTLTMPLFSAGYTAKYPFLRTQAQLESFEATTTDLSFAHREGSLFTEDVDLVEWREFRVQLTNMGSQTQTQYPIRVRLEANLNTPILRYASGSYNSTDRVRLNLVSYTIWQEGAL